MTERRPEDGFRMARDFRVGEVIAGVLAICGLVASYVEVRLRPVEAQILAMREAQTAQNEQTSAYMRELRVDLRDLSLKLDRLLEGRR